MGEAQAPPEASGRCTMEVEGEITLDTLPKLLKNWNSTLHAVEREITKKPLARVQWRIVAMNYQNGKTTVTIEADA